MGQLDRWVFAHRRTGQAQRHLRRSVYGESLEAAPVGGLVSNCHSDNSGLLRGGFVQCAIVEVGVDRRGLALAVTYNNKMSLGY